VPIYEYKCPECGNGFEKFCRSQIQSDRLQTCPECGHEKASRVLSRVGSVRAGRQGNESSCGPAGSGFS
jgi:putative FmdB family regulatory protein